MSFLARYRGKIDRWLIACLCVAAVVSYLVFVDGVYPIRTWLAWPVLTLWGSIAILHLSCLAFGSFVLERFLRADDRPPLETLVLSMAVGVVGWVLAMYVAGALGLYQRPLVFTLPALFLTLGGRALAASVRRLRDAAARLAPASPTAIAAMAFGVLGAGLVYLQLFSPDAVNYDASWCHLTVAQDYAREGRIVAFPGDYAENVPQLTPIFHLWGFLLPGLNQPLRWMFALHNEFALFLWTLAGVAAATASIVDGEGRTPRGLWAAFFLFPGIFVYDSNIGGAADHVLAFFAVPLFLAALRLARAPSPRRAILWGAVGAGALLTKYQAVYLLVPSAALVAAWWIVALVRAAATSRRAHARDCGRAIAAAAAALCLVSAPHFLRNLIFYRNPVYPFMQDVFTGSTPRFSDGQYLLKHIFTDVNWQPKGSLFEKLTGALVLFATFSFKPHYYWEFHHNVPSFGSLFTLLLPIVPFLGRQPRLWDAIVCAAGGVFLWAMTFLVDRNLQIFLPLLVVSTGGIIVLAWRRGGAARAGVGLLVALQVVWGADAMFYSGYDRMTSSMSLIRTGFTGSAKTRFSGYRTAYVELGASLPRRAVVLLHASHIHLGINRQVLLDWAGFQGIIDYRRFRTPRELHDFLKQIGVTHVVREAGQRAGSTKQEDVLLAIYLSRYATPVGNFGGLEVFALPADPPRVEPHLRVVALGVAGYRDGVYRIDQLGAQEGLLDVPPSYPLPEVPWPAEPERWPGLLDQGSAVLVGGGAVAPALMNGIESRFHRARVSAATLQVFFRD
jgi:hypothetical protein